MANRTITVPIPSIHWFTYPIVIGALLFVTWLWHSTRVNDAAAKQQVAVTTTAQTTVDKQVTDTNKATEEDLKAKNAKLEKQLADAKTAKQQAEIIDKGAGTGLSDPELWVSPLAKPQASNPSSDAPLVDAPGIVKITPEDLQKLAALTIEKQQADNQVAADKIEIAGKNAQIEVRDERIAAQNTEIKTLKGGSHFKRFLKAAKYVVIGGAIGAIAVEASHH